MVAGSPDEVDRRVVAAAGRPRSPAGGAVEARVREGLEENGDRAVSSLSIEEVWHFAVAGGCKFCQLQLS